MPANLRDCFISKAATEIHLTPFYTELSQNCSALRTIFRLPLFVPKLKKWGRAIHKDFSLIETTTWEIQSVLFSGALILLLPTDRFRMSFLDSERFKRTAL